MIRQCLLLSLLLCDSSTATRVLRRNRSPATTSRAGHHHVRGLSEAVGIIVAILIFIALLHGGHFNELEFVFHALFLLVQFFLQEGIFDGQGINLLRGGIQALAQLLTFLFFLEEHPILHSLHALNLKGQGFQR